MAEFLKALSGTFGGTNIRFTLGTVAGSGHEDSWAADSCTGSSKAVWGWVGGKWAIVKQEIQYVPKPGKWTNGAVRPTVEGSPPPAQPERPVRRTTSTTVKGKKGGFCSAPKFCQAPGGQATAGNQAMTAASMHKV